jgi:hypothetical protein
MVGHGPSAAPPSPTEEETVGLLEDYLGIGRRTAVSLVVLIALVLAAATGIYISMFGFQHWKENMKRAGDAMVINFGDPVVAGQYTCPCCGAVGLPLPGPRGEPVCPVCRGTMILR